MKKIKLLFKSGNTLIVKCKTFQFAFEKEGTKRHLEMTDVNKEEWMIDLSEVEAYTVVKCLF